MGTQAPMKSMLAAMVTGLVLLVSGCGNSGEAPPGKELGAVEALRSRHVAGSSARPFRGISELLGNHRFQAGNRPAEPLTVAVVRGDVIAVAEGRAFKVEGSDAPAGTVTDFDDADALWRTFHLTVEVAETFSGSTTDTITVGLAFGADSTLDTVKQDLTTMRDVVFFLTKSPVFGYDDNVFGTVGDGAYLAPVDSQENLSLPVLDVDESRDMLTPTDTITELRSAAKGPDVVIKLDPTGTERLSNT